MPILDLQCTATPKNHKNDPGRALKCADLAAILPHRRSDSTLTMSCSNTWRTVLLCSAAAGALLVGDGRSAQAATINGPETAAVVIAPDEDLTVTGTGSITVTGGPTDNAIYGVWVDPIAVDPTANDPLDPIIPFTGTMTLENGSAITVTAAPTSGVGDSPDGFDTSASAVGIMMRDALDATINIDSKITVSATGVDGAANSNARGYGIYLATTTNTAITVAGTIDVSATGGANSTGTARALADGILVRRLKDGSSLNNSADITLTITGGDGAAGRSGEWGYGILARDWYDGNNSLYNSGSITITATGGDGSGSAEVGADGIMVNRFFDSDNTLVNSGDISVTTTGGNDSAGKGAAYSYGINIARTIRSGDTYGGDNNTVINHGTITTMATEGNNPGAGHYAESIGIQTGSWDGTGNSIVNHGTISASGVSPDNFVKVAGIRMQGKNQGFGGTDIAVGLDIINIGTIEVTGTTGTGTGSTVAGIQMFANQNETTITNQGQINAEARATAVDPDVTATGILITGDEDRSGEGFQVNIVNEDGGSISATNYYRTSSGDPYEASLGDAINTVEAPHEVRVANSGTITGHVKLSAYDDTVDNSGTINGDVRMGAGSDVFSLTTGGVLDGDLYMDEGSNSDVDTFVLTGEGFGVFAGTVTGAELLNKTGAGTWALDGVLDISDATTISAGRLNVGSTADCAVDACTLNTPSVTVEDGGTMGGHGHLVNTFDALIGVDVTVQFGGTLAPGTSIGTLTVAGDVTVEEDGLLFFELDGGTSDYLNVAGTLTLDDGAVVSVMPTSTAVVQGHVYVLATAGTLVDDGADRTDDIGVGEDWSTGNGLGNNRGAEIEIEITAGVGGTITAEVGGVFGCFQIGGNVRCVNGDADGIPDEGDPDSPGPLTHDYNGYRNTDADTALTIVVEADAKVNNDKTDDAGASGFDIAAPMYLTINTGATVSGNLHGIHARNDASIDNYGTILAGTGSAIEADLGDQQVTNHDGATITGAINLGAGNDSLTNSGIITGNVSFGAGNDLFTNSGSFTGIADFCDDDDELINSGTFTGSVQFGGGDDVFTNDVVTDEDGAVISTGLFDTAADSDFGDGTDLFTNTGVTRVTGVVTFAGLEHFQNDGTVDMANGLTSDQFILPGTYDANSFLEIDINFNGASSADVLTVGGAATGSTTVILNDASTSPSFGVDVLIIDAGEGTEAGAFEIEGGQWTSGFLTYNLLHEASSNNFYLSNTISPGVFRPLKVMEGAQSLWYRSADAWGAHMVERRDGSANPSPLWLQVYFAETDRDDGRSFVANDFNQDINLNYSQSFSGFQFGYEMGVGETGDDRSTIIGLTGGYLSSSLGFDTNSDRVSYDAFNIGVYAGFQMGGLYANALAKYDFASADITASTTGYGANIDGKAYGIRGEVGYRWDMDGLFVEPVASIEYQQANFDDIKALGATVDFDRWNGLRGMAGFRLGLETEIGDETMLTVYGSARAVHEFAGDDGLTFLSGDSSYELNNDPINTYGRFDLGINIAGENGISGFVEANIDTGSDYEGYGGRAGVRIDF